MLVNTHKACKPLVYLLSCGFAFMYVPQTRCLLCSQLTLCIYSCHVSYSHFQLLHPVAQFPVFRAGVTLLGALRPICDTVFEICQHDKAVSMTCLCDFML